MGLFDKYCEKCGIKVDKKIAPQRFSKYFCSENHANTYMAEIETMRRKQPKQQSGGCC